MDPLITFYLPLGSENDLNQTIGEIKTCGIPAAISLLVPENSNAEVPEGTSHVIIHSLFSSDTIRKMASHTTTRFLVFYTKPYALKLNPHSIQRMIQAMEMTGAGMLYSDYYAVKGLETVPVPLIEYQEGSLRDDFNFGSLILFRTSAFSIAASKMKESWQFAGLYDLRLRLSQKVSLFHLPEYLYNEVETDHRKSGEKQFEYVDPKNRERQIEMEKVCTDYLKSINAWLSPVFKTVELTSEIFENEASVVIPVRNRVKTIGDAIQSVITQRTTFPFNLIIVDNWSDDGTDKVIRNFCTKDNRIIHHIPESKSLGIGGCWNEALFHNSCGKFAIQLDSDDLYIDDQVIQRVVNAFYEQQCAMVVGSYRMVDFNLKEIPPGIIDHKEWTPDNGRNNALRINGLGAPRAFYTPLIRKIMMPNVSYGEDYALGLAVSRYYQIGRIYEPLYLCRRWEENSDASPDIVKLNRYNSYKDKIRTMELHARQKFIHDGIALY